MSDESNAHSRMLSNRLYHAIQNDDLEQVRMCIRQGADVNMPCYTEKYREMCPLALVCLFGHEEIMEELLKTGADPNQASVWSRLLIFFIAAENPENRVLTLSMMRCLISHGADIDFRDRHGRSILHYFASGEFSDRRDELLSAAKLVLDNGASVGARNYIGDTPLYDACRFGNIDLVKFFIAEGDDANFDTGRMSILRWAADMGDIDMFDMLLNSGANRYLHPHDLVNPCDLNNHAMIARILDTCDMDINMPLDRYIGMPILHYACDGCGITSETVRLLLDRGADVRAVSDTGDTALHYAAVQCDCNKIRQLLSYNAPLNIENDRPKNQMPLAKIIETIIAYYSSRQLADTQIDRDYATNMYQAGLLTFKMLVIAGAKVTADDEHNLNQFHIKHPETQLPDYKIRSIRSLKEMCRFVIQGTIPMPVVVSLCKLPIPKLLQEYLNFPEFDPLVDEHTILSIISPTTEFDDDDGDGGGDDGGGDDDNDDDDDGGDDDGDDDDDGKEGKTE